MRPVATEDTAARPPASSAPARLARIVGPHWSPWVGAILVGAISVIMFALLRPWGVFAGVRLGGEWTFELLGVSVVDGELPALWADPTMLTNIGLFAGALGAALLSRQFAIRTPAPGAAVLGLVGGAGMGLGAQLAAGCNIGAFFTPFSALAPTGLAMMAGMLVGAAIGTRLLLGLLPRLPTGGGGGTFLGGGRWQRRQPLAGAVILAAATAVALLYYPRADLGQFGLEADLGRLLLAGVALGFVLQRSRLCFVAAFRDLYLTREAHMVRAAVVALAVGAVGVTIVTVSGLADAVAYPVGWETLVGGVIFGISMVLAGGCASSSLWRAGEGQLQLWLALLAFGLSGAVSRAVLDAVGFRRSSTAYLPDLLGGGTGAVLVALVVSLGVLAVWWAVANRVESRPLS